MEAQWKCSVCKVPKPRSAMAKWNRCLACAEDYKTHDLPFRAKEVTPVKPVEVCMNCFNPKPCDCKEA